MSFSVEKKTTLAHPFRAPGSTLISSDQSNLLFIINTKQDLHYLIRLINYVITLFFVMVLGLINQFGNIIFQNYINYLNHYKFHGF